MTVRRMYAAMVAVFIVFFLVGANIAPAAINAAPPVETPEAPGEQAGALPTPVEPPPGADEAIRAAFASSVQESPSLAPAFIMYEVYVDHIQYAQDGSTALLWLGLRDTQTGEEVATEPGLSIARSQSLASPGDPGSWQIALPADADLIEQLRALPPELLTPDIRSRFLETPAELGAASAQVFSGYRLPWTAGLAKSITNSIGHVVSVAGGLTSCPTSCRYAFDFADRTMFPMLAAKGGTVKAYKTTCANGDTSCTNYLVLEDQSTIPTSYQLYYHMAYNTIPSRLRAIGARVVQGEYIGDADDTGYSTGHHLHFHVYTSPSQANWSWGTSVDITFDDVTDNGGRPRTCAESTAYPSMGSQCQANNKYTSGNKPANPPSGRLDLPANRQTVNSRSVRLQGAASDDIAITRIQVLANYNGSWTSIDDIPPTSGAFSKDVDLCAAGIPDGPFALTLRIYDREGSLAPNIPVRQMVKAFACGGQAEIPPSMTCTPASNQVALYNSMDYRGSCQKFDLGQVYTAAQFSLVGDNKAASIQVGSGVLAVLYDRAEDLTAARPSGRIETFAANDAALADNRIGANQVSGLRVVSRTAGAPYEPLFNAPVGHSLAPGISPTSADSLVLAWEGAAGATSFDVRLTGPVSLAKTLTDAGSLSVGSLPAGSYQFTVTAKKGAALTNGSSQNFIVTAGSLPAGTVQQAADQYQESMENGPNGWTAAGIWRLAMLEDNNHAWVSNANGFDYNDGDWRAGDLTSPPIAIPASGAYFLRFDYFVDTEDGGRYWDQRLVQVAVQNGSTVGPFTDLLQLSDDKLSAQMWLKSGPVSLAQYAGKTIRLRFHFDTVDELNNTGKGWMVDNVSVTSTPPNTSCADSDNNSPSGALDMPVGAIAVGMTICPERDLDYYRVTAVANQPLVIDMNAKSLTPPSSMDTHVFLLDADGRSIIAENDDEQYGVMQDSWLSYIITRAGTYYIKVKAWDYPGSGGSDYRYEMTLRPNAPVAPREVRITYPVAAAKVPAVPFSITASAADFDGGPVAQVDFYWHGPDWNQGWVKLGSDTDGSDGWSYPVNPAQYGAVANSALVVMARSRTGGWGSAALWDLQSDLSMPVSQMAPLPASVNNSLVLLTWTASDVQNDIDRFELQYQVNSGSGFSAWQNWMEQPLPKAVRQVWFAGVPGSAYRFRIRAVDVAGNIESFPDTAEASTTLAKTCAPDAGDTGLEASAAARLDRGAFSAVHNLCRSTTVGAPDIDWYTFTANKGEPLIFVAQRLGGGAAFTISIQQTPTSAAQTWRSPELNRSLMLTWTAPETGVYYLKVEPLRPDISGTEMTYRLWYGTRVLVPLPSANR